MPGNGSALPDDEYEGLQQEALRERPLPPGFETPVRSLVTALAALLWLACEAPPAEGDGGVDAGPPLPPTPLRVATFNVKLFFDSICQSGACAAGDFEQVLTPQAFDARAADGTEVVLFAAHLRSKAMDDPGRRLAEAQVARRIVTDVATALPNAVVVMAGDLNDVPGSPPLEALTANGGLLRVAEDLPVADQYTYLFNGRGEAIDHILQAVTPAGQVVPRSAVVWKDTTRGFAGSDHFALTADFEIPRAPE